MAVPELAYVVLLAGAALQTEVFSRRAAAGAVVAAGLAIAGVRAAATPGSPGFLAATGALILVATVLAVAAGVRSGKAGARTARLLGPVALLSGAIGIVTAFGRTLLAARPTVLAAAITGVAGAGLVPYVIGRYVRFRKDGSRTLPPLRSIATAGLLAGTIAAGVGPHVGIVIGGVIVAPWSAFVLAHAEGDSRLPIVALLTVPLLGAWWLMATIAGPEGLSLTGLPLLPLSPAAERALAPVFLLAAWATAGLWPLHRQAGGGLLAPVGAILLVRIAVPAVPDGLEHWRPLAMPLLVVGVWHAALSGRRSGLAVGVAWIGLLGGTPTGRIGAALLFGAALVVELSRRSDRPDPSRLASVAAAIMGGYGGLLAIEAGLHAEVVYTVLAAGALVAAAAAEPRQAMMASDRSTTEPRR